MNLIIQHNETVMKFSRSESLRFLIILFFVSSLSSCGSVQNSQLSHVESATWDTRHVAPGVTWKYHHFDDLFDSKQSVTVLDIDLRKVNAQINYADSGFIKTSGSAHESGAVAAINGSFFDTKRGGSVVFFKHKGRTIKSSSEAPRGYWEAAGFAIDESGRVSILKRPAEGWASIDNAYTLLTSGPLLIYDGEQVEQAPEKFNTNRHPRTAVGLTKNRHLIAVVADGRSSQAHGMTTAELATVMDALNCTVAMNLDGGGSSTAWVKGQPFDGVVNYPSDNKKFDHEGEREVANCIVFMPGLNRD